MAENKTSSAGRFLVAMPSLAESFFDHALIYMLEHNEEGAMGLVINQPMDIAVDEVLSQIDADYNGHSHPQAALNGGPVEPYRGFVLHHTRSDHRWEGEMPLAGGISVTASADILQALAAGQDIGGHLIVLGYSGWGPGQLEDELADNAWLTVNAGTEIMFNTPADKRLDAVTRTLGISYHQLSNNSGHA